MSKLHPLQSPMIHAAKKTKNKKTHRFEMGKPFGSIGGALHYLSLTLSRVICSLRGWAAASEPCDLFVRRSAAVAGSRKEEPSRNEEPQLLLFPAGLPLTLHICPNAVRIAVAPC